MNRIAAGGCLVSIAIACTILLAAPGASAQESATTAPTTLPANQLSKLVNDLGSPDSAVRDHAREKLMGMGRDDLNTLKSVISKFGPLNTSQISLLREIVAHVYLATEPYAKIQKGFLGVTLAPIHLSTTQPRDDFWPADPASEHDEQTSSLDPTHRTMPGVMIQDRMPGFCGFQHLQAGDIVISVTDDQPIAIDSVARLQLTVQKHSDGDRLTFHILRRGKTLDVPLTLNGFPEELLGPAIRPEEFKAQRDQAATEYWNQAFAPLLTPHPGT